LLILARKTVKNRYFKIKNRYFWRSNHVDMLFSSVFFGWLVVQKVAALLNGLDQNLLALQQE